MGRFGCGSENWLNEIGNGDGVRCTFFQLSNLHTLSVAVCLVLTNLQGAFHRINFNLVAYHSAELSVGIDLRRV